MTTAWQAAGTSPVSERAAAPPRLIGMRDVGQRALLILAVSLYVLAFNVSYRDLVAPIFDFWGLGYNPPPAPYFWSSVVVAIVPAFWMPLVFRRPSMLLFYLQYFLMYIPACFIVYHNTRPALLPMDAARVVATMFAGLSIMQIVYFVPLARIRVRRVTPGIFWTVFVVLTVVMFAYLAATLMRNFRIANFTEIYSVRFAMVDALKETGSRFGFYAQTLLMRLFLPIGFAVGIRRRKYAVVAASLSGYVFLFGIGGAKEAILAFVSLPAGAFLFARSPRRVALTMLAGLSTLLLVGYVTQAVLSTKAHAAFVAVANFRTLAVPAQTIPQYFDFFRDHPVTHLSHVTGISSLIHYPYDLDVPYTLGFYFYRMEVGLNANFWASDGIGGFGLWGIIPMSVFCACVFWILDSASHDLDPRFMGLALSYCAFSFGSVSLFTTLITGGLAFVILIALVAPRDTNGLFTLPTLASFRRRFPDQLS